jgi:glycosyltransferase involved in cell wall biosynthesis
MSALSIAFPYVADRFGGSTASSLILAQALKEAGHRVHILTHGEGGRVTDEALTLGLDVTRLPALSQVPGYARPDRFRLEQLMAFGAARRALAALAPDIVHSNDLTTLRCWAMPALASRTALVAHWRSNFRESWSVKAALQAASRVVAVSQYSFARLPAWVRRKGVVEYNAFALDMTAAERLHARQEVRERLGLPAHAAILGVFGNHIVRKRTHVLADILDAVPQTEDGRPVYGLACGGRAEPYDCDLDRKIAAFRLGKRLFRPGFVRPVESWMAACDVILAPAIQEPLARNVLEAMALQVPVIVSRDGGLPELVKHGESGIVCDPYDLPAWIAGVRCILNRPALVSHLVENGRKMLARLTPARHAERIASVYRGLLPSQKRAA